MMRTGRVFWPAAAAAAVLFWCCSAPVRAELFEGKEQADPYLSKGATVQGAGEKEIKDQQRKPLDELNWLRKKAAEEEMERRRLEVELKKTSAELEIKKERELTLATEVEKLKGKLREGGQGEGGQTGANQQPTMFLKKGYYEVKRGDSLWRIAKREDVFSNPYKWSELYHANKEKLDNPDLIYPGQVIKIPDYYQLPDVKLSDVPAAAPQAEETQEPEQAPAAPAEETAPAQE